MAFAAHKESSEKINEGETAVATNPKLMCTDTPVESIAPVMSPMKSPKSSADCVRVAVRIRPLLEDDETCIQHRGNVIRLGTSVQFQFDQVFGPTTTQETIYENTVAPLVEQCLLGYNATCLAYGQTGSGKTHTIMGSNIGLDSDDAGVIPRALNSLFQQLDGEETQVSIQFLELYGEEIRDLLTASKTKLNIREINNEPEVIGATSLDVDSVDASLKCLRSGLLRRVTGATAMNSSSSRSHAILTVRIQQPHTRSKLHFVDLAGAERHKRTAATGKRLQEGIDINRGLSNLGNVIQALTEGRSHVPYRDAKLTRLLQGSLGGNHKTAMIACVSPAVSNMGESVNCLRYANRAKKIENTARVNDVENGSEKARIRELETQLSEVAADAIRAMNGQVPVYYTVERLDELVNEKGRVARRISSNPKTMISRPSTLTESQTNCYLESSPRSEPIAHPNSQPSTPAGHESILDISILEQEQQLIEEQKGLLSTIQSVFLDEQDEFTYSESMDTPGTNGKLDSPDRLMKSESKILKVASALEELSQSIEVKERLIEQIKQNKEREDAMRKFYEQQLDELHSALNEKEAERDQLLKDLENAKEHSSDDLKARLQAKERQIESLRKVQLNYKKQSATSARAAADLSKLAQLQDDVKLMKKRKADMQKELTHEKRMHQKELTRLNKVVGQKDREISKIQRVSTEHQIKAEKAVAISKKRLEELAQLKKTLRRYKKEVGLDPILVGKRQSKRQQEIHGNSSKTFDADQVRDYFDKKVATVVRKEALVDKLAKEWEEYFELYSALNELGETSDDSDDSRQTLQLQIQFVNDKIRKTAKRLRNDQVKQGGNDIDASEFMFDEEFMKLCHGNELSGATKDAAAKVLFGMVVRERRRVASLAKAAASLDERLQKAEKNSSMSETALRTFVKEHEGELSNLQEKHQEHIISLMEMVSHKASEESSSNASLAEFNSKGVDAEQKLQKQLLLLANERVETLELQLADIRNDKISVDEFEEKLQETQNNLLKSKERSDWLERSRNDLRSVVRQIRHEAEVLSGSKTSDVTKLSSRVLTLTDSVLHPGVELQERTTSNGEKRIRCTHLSPRLQKHIELMHSSDSEGSESDNDEDPIWAASIMEDLALIAEGKVPPSLSPQRNTDVDETGSVFDRLANPRSYTGTQKRKVGAPPSIRDKSPLIRKRLQESGSHINETESDTENRSDLTLAVPSDEMLELPHLQSVEGIDQNSSPTEHQSVFDRLFSPSYFTGTQKNRIQESKARRVRSADDAANRVLGGLLDEESDRSKFHESFSRRLTPEMGDDSSLIQNSSADSPKQFQESLETLEVPDVTQNIAEYTRQNVFDRLQKTTTQSAAVRQAKSRNTDAFSADSRYGADNRHSEVAAEKYSLRNEAKRGQLAMAKTSDEKHEQTKEYISQNVFERLTKTSTEAFSKKIHQ